MIMKFHPRDNRQEQRSHQIGIDYGEENNGFVNSLANKIFVLKTSCKFTSSSFFFYDWLCISWCVFKFVL